MNKLAWLLILMCPSLSFGNTDKNAGILKRWAILPSEEARHTHIPDLLFVQLSEIDSIELVEREELNAALQESSLNRALGAQGVNERLRLGRLLQADALVIVDLVVKEHDDNQDQTKPKKQLRIVICETNTGARLQQYVQPYTENNAEQCSSSICSLIDQVRTKYASGIRQVIGVAPLVSQNLVHDWDYLQSGLANVIHQGISVLPGVAVIEMEEVRAIRRELGITADGNISRKTPVLIEGKYRVKYVNDLPTIDITLISTFHEDHSETLELNELVLKDSINVLQETVLNWLRQMNRDLKTAIPASIEEQVQYMKAIADTFICNGSA